jgi:hypothetical protein
VQSGPDNGGIFGPTGADLTGSPFSIICAFDTSRGLLEEAQPGRFIVSGGGAAGRPGNSPSLGAIVTINGQTTFIGGDFLGSLNGPGPSNIFLQGMGIRSGTTFSTDISDLRNNMVDAVSIRAPRKIALTSDRGQPWSERK